MIRIEIVSSTLEERSGKNGKNWVIRKKAEQLHAPELEPPEVAPVDRAWVQQGKGLFPLPVSLERRT